MSVQMSSNSIPRSSLGTAFGVKTTINENSEEKSLAFFDSCPEDISVCKTKSNAALAQISLRKGIIKKNEVQFVSNAPEAIMTIFASPGNRLRPIYSEHLTECMAQYVGACLNSCENSNFPIHAQTLFHFENLGNTKTFLILFNPNECHLEAFYNLEKHTMIDWCHKESFSTPNPMRLQNPTRSPSQWGPTKLELAIGIPLALVVVKSIRVIISAIKVLRKS